MINRRHFMQLSGLAAAATGLSGGFGLGENSAIAAKPVYTNGSDPLFKISIAQWSFHRNIRSKKMDNLDFAKVSKDMGFDGIEYVNGFFKQKGKDFKYLAEMDKRCKDNDIPSVLIMVDGEGALGDPDAKRRTKAIENHYQWVVAAKYLGCHSIRVNAQSRGKYAEQMKLAADGLGRLTEFGDRFGINVIVENHGGLSSNGKWLSGVMKKVNMAGCGTLPDFGNFHGYDRYMGIEELMPFAKAVSAKSHAFDKDGNETKSDYYRIMKTVLDHGYRGYVGVEFEGGGDEKVGVMKTKKLLEKVRAHYSK